MPKTQIQSTQEVNDAELPRLGLAARSTDADIEGLTDQELDFPLRLSAAFPTANSRLYIRSSLIASADGSKKSAPPIASQIFDIADSYIDFQTKTTSGPILITWPTVTSGQYIKAGLTLLPSGFIQVIFSPSGATNSSTLPANPGTLFINGGQPIGWVNLQSTGSGFKTADSVTNIIEASGINRFGVGGAPSASGNANEVLERLKDWHLSSVYSWMDTNVFSIDTITKVDSGTATYDVASQSYKFQAGQTLISKNCLDEDFKSEGVEVLQAEVSVVRDTALSSDKVELSRDGVNYVTVTTSKVGNDTLVGNATFSDPTYPEQLVANTPNNINQAYTSFKVTFSNQTVSSIGLFMYRLGTPAGTLTLQIRPDNAGVPSNTITATSAGVSAATLTTGLTRFSFSDVALNGVYHLILVADNQYLNSVVLGTTNVGLMSSSLSSGISGTSSNGTTWVSGTLAYSFSVMPKPELSQYLNESTVYKLLGSGSGTIRAQQFTITEAMAVEYVTLRTTRAGSANGSLYATLVKSVSNNPSSSSLDILSTTSSRPIANNVMNLSFPSPVLLTPGSYFLVFYTDATYKTNFNTNTNYLGLLGNSVAIAGVGLGKESTTGDSWTTVPPLSYSLVGYKRDLRVRITANEGAVLGYGVLYGAKTGLVTGVLNKETQWASINQTTFTVSKFLPSSDLLKVYDTSGRCFVSPFFTIQGQQVIFPAGTFTVAGPIVFDQTQGSSFDNSDRNASLLAANFLGSLDGNIDKSAPGRGILLRDPTGQLYEITVRTGGTGFDIYMVTA